MKVWYTVYDNDVDAFVPEVWAQEALIALEANCVAANLVYRNFENLVADFGDIVNTRIPASFFAQRKGPNDDVTVQNVNVVNVPVPLNQHLHTSFMIRDSENSKSMKDLINEHLIPAVHSLSQTLDSIICMQGYVACLAADGVVGQYGTAVTIPTLTQVRSVMNKRKVPLQGRNLLICPDTEAELLEIATFHEADKLGDDGTALREGSLGRKFGFNIYMDQNVPDFDHSGLTVAGTVLVDSSNGLEIGETEIPVSGGTDLGVSDPAELIGCWCYIEGDMTPQWIVGTTNNPKIIISPGLRHAVDNGAEITIFEYSSIAETDGYTAGHYKDIDINALESNLYNGQLVTIGQPVTADLSYSPFNPCRINGVLQTEAGSFQASATSLVTDRPLGYAASNGDIVALGPCGQFNLAFHSNAIALVTRPLALPRAELNVASSVVNYNNLSIRVTMTYDGKAQGTLVTVDLLAGVLPLNSDLMVVMLA